MDGFFGNKKSDSSSSPTSHTEATGGGSAGHKPSTTELLSSAKVVADAAKSSFGGGKSEMDKAKVAGAAEDLLNAAEDYGKLGESGYGKYLDKAEDYLHKYRSETGHDPPKTETHSSGTGKESKPEEKHEGGGMGDAMKMAGSFFK